MDGSILKGAVSDTVTEEMDIQQTDKYGRSEAGEREWSETEEAELEKRLSDMGYLG